MNHPPSLPGSADLDGGSRALRALLGGVVLFCLAFFAWGIVQFMAAASAPRRVQELLGYQAIVTGPAAGVVGAIVGAVLGWITPRGQLRWRTLKATGVITILAVLWAAYLWLAG